MVVSEKSVCLSCDDDKIPLARKIAPVVTSFQGHTSDQVDNSEILTLKKRDDISKLVTSVHFKLGCCMCNKKLHQYDRGTLRFETEDIIC